MKLLALTLIGTRYNQEILCWSTMSWGLFLIMLWFLSNQLRQGLFILELLPHIEMDPRKVPPILESFMLTIICRFFFFLFFVFSFEWLSQCQHQHYEKSKYTSTGPKLNSAKTNQAAEPRVKSLPSWNLMMESLSPPSS